MIGVLVHEYLAARMHDWLPTDISHDVTHGYLVAATRLVHGAIPYADFHYEYPPGTLPFLALARAVSGSSPGRFLVAWTGLMVLLDLAVLAGLARTYGWRARALCFWVLALPALGPMALARNDVIAAAAVIGAVIAIHRGRGSVAGMLLGYGVLTKVWPIVLIGLLVVMRRRDARAVASGAIATLGVAAFVLAAVGALSPMLDSLSSYHGHRPLEIESSWAVALLAIAATTAHPIHPVYTYLSFNVPPSRAHGLAPIAYRLSYAVEAVALAAAIAFRRAPRGGRDPGCAGDATMWWLGLAAVAAGLAVAPVLSPQYVLWLDAAVVAVLVHDRRRSAVTAAAITLSISALSQAEYPFLFTSLHAGDPGGIAVTAIRDLAVVALAVYAATIAARRRRQQPSI